jgi:ketosteroid isomerase-like protein
MINRTRASVCVMIFLALVLAKTGTAAAGGPGLRADFDGLVAAERGFARLSEEKGIKESFLANVAADAVIFRPGPVPAKEWLSAHPDTPALLTWHPTQAAIARSGDLGWTTGPYEIAFKGQPKGYGQYSTVWRKEADGRWKFVVDLGVTTPSAAPGTGEPKLPAELAGAAKPVKAATSDLAAVRESLLAADRDMGKIAKEQGLTAAYAGAVAEDTYLLRDAHPPFVGKEAIRGFLATDQGGVTWESQGSGVSAAGDLGYVYGKADRKDPHQSGVYLRVWQRQPGGTWKLALDVMKLEMVRAEGN